MPADPFNLQLPDGDALRMVREALADAATGGLAEDEMVQITIDATADGVVLPDQARAESPSEITIGFKRELCDRLHVGDDAFEIAFPNDEEGHLAIPFAAIKLFRIGSLEYDLKQNTIAAVDEPSKEVDAADSTANDDFQVERVEPDILVNRGNALFTEGDLTGAIAAYDAAIAIMSGLRELLESSEDWSPELSNDLATAHMNRGIALAEQGRAAEALLACTAAISIRTDLQELLQPRGQWSSELRNDLAAAYMNLGNALADHGDLGGALAAYDAAMAVRKDLRELLEPRGEWTPALRNDFANVYMNRGVTLVDQGKLAAAVMAYDAAIVIMSSLRDLLEPYGQWSPELSNDLAGAHMNRGNALLQQGQPAGAVEDFEAAIAVRNDLRELLEPSGEWSPSLRDELAIVHANRGLALSDQGNLAGAVAACDAAIAIMSELRELLEPSGEWSPALRNHLAAAHLSRGNALSDQGNLAGALAAYDAAVDIRSDLRALLEPHGEWSPALGNDLAAAHMSRGNALLWQDELAAAVAAYNSAIAIGSGLRDLLEPRGEWSPTLRNDLANVYVNRGNALSRQGELIGAVTAYNAAIGIRAELRELLEPRGEWSPTLRDDLAAAHMNRGVALRLRGDLPNAVSAHDAAIAIRTDLRELLEPRGEWSPALRNGLAGAHMNRGNALADQGNLVGALAAFDAAITVMGGVQELLEPRGQWSPELRNDFAGAHLNRGIALSDQGELAEAVKAHDAAIAIRTGMRELLQPRGEWWPALRGDLAVTHLNRGNTLVEQRELAAALASYQMAEQLYDDRSGIGGLPHYDRYRLKLWANMAHLFSSMDDPQGWAIGKSRRMAEIMELAPSVPEGRFDPWREVRVDFARFHAMWLKHCIDTGSVDLVPMILSAIQGRELATKLLDELTAMEQAGQLSPAVAAYQQLRMDLRKLQARIAGIVEGARSDGLTGGSRGLETAGLHELSTMSVDTRARRLGVVDGELLRRLEAEYRDLHRKLPELRTAAAQEDGYEALIPPRLDAAMLVEDKAAMPGSGVAADEALVLFVDLSHGADVEGALVLRHGREPQWIPLPGVRALAAEIDRVSHRLGTSARLGGGFRYAGQRADDHAGQRGGGLEGVPGAKSPPQGELTSELPTQPETDLSAFWEDMEGRNREQVWQPLAPALEGIGQVVCVTQGRLHLLPLELGAPKGKTLRHYPGLVYYGYSRGLLGRNENRQSQSRSHTNSEAASPPPAVGLVGYGGEQDSIPFVWGEVDALKRLHEERHRSVRTGDPYDHRQDGSSPASPTEYALLHLACHGIPVGEGMRERVVLQLGPGRLLDMGRIMESRVKVDQVLIAACLGGKVREDLDGEPSGVVGGYLYRGSSEVAAAVVALPDSWTMLASILIHQAWLESGSLGEAVTEGKRRLAEKDWYPDTERLFTEAANAALAAWRERNREPLRRRLVHALTYDEDRWKQLVAPLKTPDDPDRYDPSTLREGAAGEAWGERIAAVAAEVADRLLDLDPLRHAVDEVLTLRVPPQPLLGAIIHGMRTFGEARPA